MLESQQIYDVYDIVEQPLWYTQWPVIFTLVAVFCTVLALFFLLGSKKRSLSQKTIGPWDYAQQELALLEQLNLYTQEDHKKFYTILTHMLKRYLQEYYALNEGNTDQELLALLKKKNIPQDILTHMHEIMHHAFMVKFAHHEGLLSHMEQDKQRAREILEMTKAIKEEDKSGV